MARTRTSHIRVLELAERPGKKKPHGVRWYIGDQEHSRWFKLKTQADDLRSAIITAINSRDKFSEETGLPFSWASSDLTFALHAKQWFDAQKSTWAPRSRRSAAESLARALSICVKSAAPNLSASEQVQLMKSIKDWLAGDQAAVPAYINRWSIPLADMTTARCLDWHEKLSQSLPDTSGKTHPLKANTVTRYRVIVRAVLNDAIQRKLIETQPWPAAKKGKQRSITRKAAPIRIDLLPDPTLAAQHIDAVVSHQPQSKGYRVVLALVYYAGLRPSEARVLRIEDLTLPINDGEVGSIRIEIADRGAGSRFTDVDEDSGPPKTFERTVPMVAPLARIIKEYIGDRTRGLIVKTRTDSPITESNLDRAWSRARGSNKWRVYDLRHACATLWLRQGVPIGTAAKWLGHSPEVLLSTYTGILSGDNEVAALRINSVFDSPE